jgi:uncharacterized protein YycO
VTPQHGDIGVVPGSGFVAWCIRRITRSTVAHAFLYAGDGHVIEGDPHGVRYNDAASYPDVIWLTNLSAGLSDAQRNGIMAWAIARLGTPYSWIDDAEIGFVDLFGRAPRWMRNRLRSSRTLMCSQLCDMAYSANGAQIFTDNRPAGGVSPGDLFRAARDSST